MEKLALKNGQTIIIKKATKEDAQKMLEYMNYIGGESDFLTFGSNELELTVEVEEQIIETINSKDNSIMAVALIDENIVGSLVFRGGERNRTKHTGETGISVRKAYWGLGIGRILMNFLIEWAKGTNVVRKINLRVRNDNTNAIALYEKFGFKEEGTITRDFYIDGKFYDSIQMGLSID